MNPGGERCFELPSDLDQLAALRPQVFAIALAVGFSKHESEDFELCVHEAVANAMVHGHGLDASRVVRLCILPRDDGLQVRVSDSGPGYAVPGASAASPPGEEPRGRGLQIICQLTDDQAWSDGGRTLTFFKRRVKGGAIG